MRLLLLNQTFYPDVASTAQHLADVALGLKARGHDVTVISSQRAYDDQEKRFPRAETWRGVRIIRICSTTFGKTAKWRRALDFASFMALCALRLVFLPRQAAVLALTSPPLISFLGALFTKLRGGRFYYWVMDFNPDEAIAAGWLGAGSVAARLLDALSRFSLRQATTVIALDRFMKDRIVAKGIAPEKIVVIPPWSHDDEVRFDAAGRDRFRQANSLDGKFVVMYSGNHSPCHPLETLLRAAERVSDDEGVQFCFVGGGSEWRKIQAQLTDPQPAATSESGLRTPPNSACATLPASRSTKVLLLPYQPLSELSGSLSAADLHVVVMGDPFVGLVHPCKIYNILSVGAPVLYIGPAPSHVTDVLTRLGPCYPSSSVRHGDVDQVVAFLRFLRSRQTSGPPAVSPISREFSKSAVLPGLISVLQAEAPGA